jgi:DNA-binding response OmpR family regulator
VKLESGRLVGADDALRTLLRYELLLDGLRVLTARTGREVLDAVDDEEVDVILTNFRGLTGEG